MCRCFESTLPAQRVTIGPSSHKRIAFSYSPPKHVVPRSIAPARPACAHHWTADLGFYGNARRIGDTEVPYYQMLLGGGYDEQGLMRFGLAVPPIPARLAPEAVTRVLDHFIANRQPGESFRQYVLRHKVETFRELTGDLAKPRRVVPRNLPGLGRR